MSEEYKTLKDAPLNTQIEANLDREWEVVTILYKGADRSFVVGEDGSEFCPANYVKWRYPIDPLEELENKILELWRGQDIDYAWDAWNDIPHRWILQVMLDSGADPAKL